MKTLHTVLIYLLLMLLSGCSQQPAVPSKVFNTVLIKNSSKQHIKTFFISVQVVDSKQKVGSISPLMANTQQVFERPDQAKMIPSSLNISWITYDNKVYQHEVNMAPLIQEARMTDRKTLIFDIETIAQLNVYNTNKKI